MFSVFLYFIKKMGKLRIFATIGEKKKVEIPQVRRLSINPKYKLP
jgi:hypothetical protein